MTPPVDARFGRRLRELRLARGLSQSQLASPNYTHAFVSSIEAGRRTPSPQALRHLADRLEVDLQELATGQPADLKERLGLRLLEARRLLSTGALAEARSEFEAVVAEARLYGLDRLETKGRFGLAHCEERAGKWEEAIELYERAEAAAEGRFTDVHADIVAGKARCIEALGDRPHAVYLLDRTIRDLQRKNLHDPLTLLKLYAPLAFSACEAGFYTQASQAARYALEYESSVEDPLTLATTHVNVARALLEEGEQDAALRSLHRAEEFFDQLDLRLELGRAHLAHGIVLARAGDDGAAAHLQSSLETFEAVGSELDQARALVELGRFERRRGSVERAPSLLTRALELLGRTEDVGERALAHLELGLAFGVGEPEGAEKNLREAAELYLRAEVPLGAAAAYRYLGELHESVGQDGCESFRNAAMLFPLEGA